MRDLMADIAGQPETLMANAAMLDAVYASFANHQPDCDYVITGMATSLWGWHAAGITLRRSRRNPLVVDCSEYLRFGCAEEDDRPLVITSRSGESVEIVRLLDEVAQDRLVVGITSNVDSPLAKRATAAHCFLAEEAAFYNTKSFTMTLAIAAASAGGMLGDASLAPTMWLHRIADQIQEFLSRQEIALGDIAELLAQSRIALLTGRGYLIGLAKQAALDLQEGMRIGAIATPGGLLRHGPIELTKLKDAMVLLLIPDDHVVPLMTTLARDLTEAGARVAIVASDGIELPFSVPVLRVPRAVPELNPVLFAVVMQTLNVALAKRLGLTDIRPALVPKVTRVE